MIDHPFLSILLGIAILYIAGLLSKFFLDLDDFTKEEEYDFWPTIIKGITFLGGLAAVVGMILSILMLFGLEL